MPPGHSFVSFCSVFFFVLVLSVSHYYESSYLVIFFFFKLKIEIRQIVEHYSQYSSVQFSLSDGLKLLFYIVMALIVTEF